MSGKDKRYFFRRIVYLTAGCIVLAVTLDAAASQTSQKIKEAGQKIEKLEQQKEDAKKKVGALKEQESHLKGELAEFNQQLSDVSAQINDLEVRIDEKQVQIKVAKRELKDAEATKASQYESMKARIRFIYERGGVDLAAVFLGSSSMAELLNKAEYVEEINRYDREMLNLYEETCKQITEKKQNLKSEKAELLAMQESMEQKKEEVNSLIAKTQKNISAKQGEISDAQDEVGEYDNQIAKMKAYEEELERQKAEEAKRIAAEQKKKQEEAQKKAAQQKKPQGSSSSDNGNTASGSTGNTPAPGGGNVAANASDLAMLAALVECEAGGESYEGQWAVASVVVNRVRSGSFPNTISGVIYQGGQFSPVASGRFAMVLSRGAAGSCTQAAQAAISGSTNVNCLYFCRASSGVQGTVIGNHVFY